MAPIDGDESKDLVQNALHALNPGRFGLHRFQHGWLREFPGIGSVAVAALSWPHNQVTSFDDAPTGRETSSALGLIVHLQESVWGFPPQETVPVNVLSILEDTGGSLLGAYDLSRGFNSDGWLGFAIGMGTRSGEMYSHMLGVRSDLRGHHNLGWYLKLLQGYLAIEAGHHSMTWTFDPLRGANGRLNLEKLAATMVNLTIDKYGAMKSSLYGEVPTDRFTAHWDLLSDQVHTRLHQVCDGIYHPRSLPSIAAMPEVRTSNVQSIVNEPPIEVTYEIPGDIDSLMERDPETAIAWRQDMRDVLGSLMTTRRAITLEDEPHAGPISVSAESKPGLYDVTGFATGEDERSGNRRSYYVLTRKESL